jgi:hypothetical protein
VLYPHDRDLGVGVQDLCRSLTRPACDTQQPRIRRQLPVQRGKARSLSAFHRLNTILDAARGRAPMPALAS